MFSSSKFILSRINFSFRSQRWRESSTSSTYCRGIFRDAAGANTCRSRIQGGFKQYQDQWLNRKRGVRIYETLNKVAVPIRACPGQHVDYRAITLHHHMILCLLLLFFFPHFLASSSLYERHSLFKFLGRELCFCFGSKRDWKDHWFIIQYCIIYDVPRSRVSATFHRYGCDDCRLKWKPIGRKVIYDDLNRKLVEIKRSRFEYRLSNLQATAWIANYLKTRVLDPFSKFVFSMPRVLHWAEFLSFVIELQNSKPGKYSSEQARCRV